jgi:hypothetical protein
MSKGGSGSGTTRVEPPKYQLPYLEAGLQRADALYRGAANSVTGPVKPSPTGGLLGAVAGGKGGSPDGSVLGAVPIAGFTPDQIAAQNQIRARASGGDPTINAASGYVQNSLNGGFLGSNPYLDSAFEKARLATQSGLASEFGRSGRNVDQSQGLRAQQMNDLATSIYGGAYENERNRMQGVLPYAQQLGNQAYTDASQLNQIGTLQQQQYQNILDAPSTALDQYLARVRGTDYGSNTTVPGGGFSGAGALGGGLAGAGIAQALSLSNPWTLGLTIGGGLLGGLF